MSDNEQFDQKSHNRLLQAISKLGKAQHIRESTRSEPHQMKDEFHLLKNSKINVFPGSDEHKKHPIHVKDVVYLLKNSKKYFDSGKKLKNVQTAKKLLRKPPEKPKADRIKRTVGYETVKKKLERWDAVVAKSRSEETQVFPLKVETIYINTTAHAKKTLPSKVNSDLMREMQATSAKLKAFKKAYRKDTTDEKDLEKQQIEQLKKKLTREELIAKRKEIAYLRMRESQKSAKARLKNKIKSKKYHNLLKQQRMKEQIKEFELLQKTNPEAALKKLNALERSRVLERASLRHKNTGIWAKNLQVRAKYDKEARKDLVEQLQISRQLTEKITELDTDSDENIRLQKSVIATTDVANNDLFNPWTLTDTMSSGIGGIEKSNNENWRQYWLKRNSDKKLLAVYKESLGTVRNERHANENNPVSENSIGDAENFPNSFKEVLNNKETIDSSDHNVKKELQRKPKILKGKSKKKSKMVNGFVVTKINETINANLMGSSIDHIFDKHECKIYDKFEKKLKIMSNKVEKFGKTKFEKKEKKAQNNKLKNLNDLLLINDNKKPIIDDELITEKETGRIAAIEVVDSNSNATVRVFTNELTVMPTSCESIDPNKLAIVKLNQKHIKTMDHFVSASIGDNVVVDEDMDEETFLPIAHQMTICQAFEDDDIITDFSENKTKVSQLKNTEIELSMPGWGSWAGNGISKEPNINKNKRLVLRLVEEEKRRDDNKNVVYINEEINKNLRNHLVSDVPFPFTSLKEYEASIRAPIGRNFIPETAFRMLTRPSVITRKGAIIDAMDESELIKPSRKLRHVVDRRILRVVNEKQN